MVMVTFAPLASLIKRKIRTLKKKSQAYPLHVILGTYLLGFLKDTKRFGVSLVGLRSFFVSLLLRKTKVCVIQILYLLFECPMRVSFPREGTLKAAHTALKAKSLEGILK